MDPDRNLAIGYRLKTSPELFQICLGSIHRACQKVEVFGQLLSHLKLFLESDRAVMEQYWLAVQALRAALRAGLDPFQHATSVRVFNTTSFLDGSYYAQTVHRVDQKHQKTRD